MKTNKYDELIDRIEYLCAEEDILLTMNIRNERPRKGEILGTYNINAGINFLKHYGRISVFAPYENQASVLIHELAHHYDYKHCNRIFSEAFSTKKGTFTRDKEFYYRSMKAESLAFYVQDYLCNEYKIPQTWGRKFYQTPTSITEKRKASFIISKIEAKLNLKEL